MSVYSKERIGRSKIGNSMVLLFLALAGIVMVVPLLFTVLQSIKPMEEIFIFPPRFWVNRPTLNNFTNLFMLASDLWVPFSRYLFNSLFVTVVSTVMQVVFASMAAYPLAKHNFMGKAFFFNLVVFALLFSYDVVFIPQYIFVSKLGWADKYISLILPTAAYSLGLYLMRQNLLGFPDSILESARIDGAKEAAVFWKIVMPSMKAVWLTMIVFSFGTLWSRPDITFIYSEQLKSLPTLLQQISSSGIARMGVGSATSVILIIPPILIFIITQSNVMETMAKSGMKE